MEEFRSDSLSQQLQDEGVIPSPLNLFLPWFHSAALPFPGVSAPYHESSAICLFSLDRVQALYLQLCECGFNIRFIEARHLLIRNQGSPEQNELSKEMNRSTEHNT